MEFQSQEISYSLDSKRIMKPEETVEKALETLRDEFDVSLTAETHKIAPGLKTAVLDGEDSFFWKSRTTTRGKGLTHEQSTASAVGEYIERYTGTKFIEENRGVDKESGNEKKTLGDILPPLEESNRCKNELSGLYPSLLGDTCPLKKGRWRDRAYMILTGTNECSCWQGISSWKAALGFSGGLQESVKLSAEDDWMRFYSLEEQEEYDLPFEMMTATTNGLASGNCLEEATLHGILEVIERDESFRQLLEVSPEQIYGNELIQPEELPDNIKEKFDEEELEKLIIVHSRSEICPEVHIFQTIATWKPERGNILAPDIEVFCGKGAHLDPEYALQRSITETFQGISSIGADQIFEPSLGDEASYVKLSELEDNSTGNLKENILKVQENLQGESEIFVREIPSEGFELSVIKCVISNALGPPIQSVSEKFHTEIIDYEPSLIEKQGIKSMRAFT